jgi:hypothetical protein
MVVVDTPRDMGSYVLVDLTLGDALSDLETSEFDVALIHVGLHGESVRLVMFALQERGMPFAVAACGFPWRRLSALPCLHASHSLQA